MPCKIFVIDSQNGGLALCDLCQSCAMERRPCDEPANANGANANEVVIAADLGTRSSTSRESSWSCRSRPRSLWTFHSISKNCRRFEKTVTVLVCLFQHDVFMCLVYSYFILLFFNISKTPKGYILVIDSMNSIHFSSYLIVLVCDFFMSFTFNIMWHCVR